MSVFDDILTTAKNAADVVGKKAVQVKDISRLRLNIIELNKEIGRNFEALGRLVYDAGKTGNSYDVNDSVAAIDERYEELMQQPHDEMDCIELLCWLNQELFTTIENTVSIELLARLFSSQLVTKGEKHLLDRKRTYYRLLRQIVSQGQECEELTDTRTVSEIVKAYAMFERGLMYDWCLSGGEYSLVQYAREMMPLFLDGFRKK